MSDFTNPRPTPAQERERYYRRRCELPSAILDLAQHNVLVHRSVERFTVGHIVTPEECLCQCIVDLARNWEEAQRRACETMLAHASLNVPPITKQT